MILILSFKTFENLVISFDTKENYQAATEPHFECFEKLSFIKTILLSGGIGLEEIRAVNEITKTNLPVYAIDVNSKFEIEPGLKHKVTERVST
jgi:phosphoribosylanthranilate isomerase